METDAIVRPLAMTEFARDHGVLDTFRDAVMDAHWHDGKDIESDDPDNAFYTRNQGPFTLTEVDNTEHAYAGLVTGVAGK